MPSRCPSGPRRAGRGAGQSTLLQRKRRGCGLSRCRPCGGAPSRLPPRAGSRLAGEHLAAHRRELEHQARLLRQVPSWYVGPLVPGLALILGLTVVESEGVARLGVLGAAVFVAVTLVAVVLLNRRAAEQLEAEARVLETGTDEA
jgi:hypothetical protein